MLRKNIKCNLFPKYFFLCFRSNGDKVKNIVIKQKTITLCEQKLIFLNIEHTNIVLYNTLTFSHLVTTKPFP